MLSFEVWIHFYSAELNGNCASNTELIKTDALINIYFAKPQNKYLNLFFMP